MDLVSSWILIGSLLFEVLVFLLIFEDIDEGEVVGVDEDNKENVDSADDVNHEEG